MHSHYILQMIVHLMQIAKALIFCVDSQDSEKMAEAHRYLRELVLREDGLPNLPLLVFANKQDLPGALSAGEVKGQLGLDELQGGPHSKSDHVISSQ